MDQFVNTMTSPLFSVGSFDFPLYALIIVAIACILIIIVPCLLYTSDAADEL